jgi:MFS family permease
MTRNALAVAALAAALAAGPMMSTEASARDGRRTAFAIGAIAGIGGAIIGAAIAKAQPRHHGYVANDRYVDEDECFRKPVRRFDRYTGEVIVVGTQLVCR